MPIKQHNLERGFLARLLLLCTLICTYPILCQAEQPTTNQTQAKNVLILYSYGHGGRGIDIFDDGLVAALNSGGVATNQLFFEFLDLERKKADPQHRSRMKNFLVRKYADQHIDVVVTVQQPALDFLLSEGIDLAQGAPAVTVQAPVPSVDSAGHRRVISQLARFDIKGTLERALELFPDTRRVVFVSGSSEADRRMVAEAASIVAPWQGKLEFEYTSDASLDATFKRVANLPLSSIIIFTQYNRDVDGKVTVAYEVEAMVAKAANAPVFGLYDFNLLNGGIGGSVVSVKRLGESTGHLVLDLLSGKRRLTETVSSATNEVIPMFDWSQTKRWGGDVRRLPANTIFVNRVPTFWEKYKLYVVGLGIFTLAQSLLIAVLIASRRRRRIAELSLKESNFRWKFAIEGSGDGLWDWNVPQSTVFFTPRWKEMLGFAQDEIGSGLDEWSKRIHPDDLVQVMADVQAHLDGTTPLYINEHRVSCKDGSYKWVLDRGLVVERDAAGKPLRMIGTHSDITERKQAEQQITELNRDFVAFLENTTDFIYFKDKASRFRFCSQTLANLTGHATWRDMVGKHDLEVFPAETAQIYYEEELPVFRDALPLLNKVDPFYDESGNKGWVSTNKWPLLDQGGEVAGLFGISRDITERVRTEAELIRHRNHLEELVSTRTLELEQSRDAAEAGNRAKTIFLANMSHELRTPMNGVMGMIDLALRRATDPRQIDMLNKSKGAAQRMVNVVNDILDFSKIEAERLPLEEKNFSLSQMIDDVVAMQDLTAEAKGLTLIREIPATFPDQLSGDAFRVRQILLNFLGNACKFSEQGMITVRASVVEQDGSSVLARIEVEDQGIGISPEQQAMLFQAFTQADGSMTRKYGGSGLGLVISKRLAKLMGGDVGVVSQEGQGSTFWVTVRLKPAKAGAVGG